MSAFQDFVQLELPKRPYLDTDVAVETVIVRRGVGPRQLSAVTLVNGQVLGMVAGTLQGVPIGAGATLKKYSETISVAATAWTLTHGQASTNFVAQVFSDTGSAVIPDEIETTSAAVITVRFNTPQTGTFRAIFLE